MPISRRYFLRDSAQTIGAVSLLGATALTGCASNPSASAESPDKQQASKPLSKPTRSIAARDLKMLDVAGLTADVHTDGHSLQLPPIADRAILLELLAFSYQGKKFPSPVYWGGVRTADRKLVWRERRADGDTAGDVDLIQLFDVAADPLEQRSIAGERPAEVRAMAARFEAAAAPAQVVGERHHDGGTARVTDDDRARLQALGYLD